MVEKTLQIESLSR